MAASIEQRVAAFLTMQQHGEVSIIHFLFMVILFLPCLFLSYPLCQCCVHKSSTLFLYFCFRSSSNQLRICFLNITVWREVFKKFLHTKSLELFFTRIYFSIESNTKYPDYVLFVLPNSKNTEVLERGQYF